MYRDLHRQSDFWVACPRESSPPEASAAEQSCPDLADFDPLAAAHRRERASDHSCARRAPEWAGLASEPGAGRSTERLGCPAPVAKSRAASDRCRTAPA